MSSYEGYIRAVFNNQDDLDEFVEYRAETGGQPVDVDGLIVVFNFFSHGDEIALRSFLRERDAIIMEDEVTKDNE